MSVSKNGDNSGMKRFKKFEAKYGSLFSLIFSFFALVISARTCSYSNKGLKITENQGMPFLQVINVKLIDPVNKSSLITLDLNLKNLGLTPATNVSVEMDYNVGDNGPRSKGNSSTRINVNDIGQGSEYTIRLKSNRFNREEWKTNTSNVYQTGYFYGTVFYSDKYSGKIKKVDWCFELPLKSEESLNQLVLNQSTFYKFESKYKIEKQ
jgi:hypothetical protein